MAKKLLIFFSLLPVLSCELIVNVDPPQQDAFWVVNSLFMPDSTWVVSISRSHNVLNEDPFERVTNAAVSILDAQGQVVTDTDHIGNGVYRSSSRPLEGERYQIKVEVKGEIFTASSKVPVQVPISSLTADENKFTLKFNDPPGEVNYYLILAFREWKYFDQNLQDTVYVSDQDFIDPLNPIFESKSFGEGIYIDDGTFDGEEVVFDALSVNGQLGKIYLLSLSEEYYKYFTSLGLQEYADGEALFQPVQVYSNIQNGLGIFAGYSVSVAEVN